MKVSEVKGLAGRPTKLTPEIIREAELLASYGLTLENMADFWGVGTTTVDEWNAENEEFRASIKKGRSLGVVSMTNELVKRAKNGDTTAIIFFLKNRAPHLWKDRREEKIEHTIGAPTWTEQRIVDPAAIDAEQVVIDAAKAIEHKRKKKGDK